ncbi:MAG TPA: hypothetical protein VEJ36_08195 [Nitrososphaerales archaeon]|nr:hypothetical protein [Nitrososphaerales archaeon]
MAALLVFSGIVLLIPFAPSVHATNESPPQVSVISGSPILGDTYTDVVFQITNPATNLYAIESFTLTLPSGWTMEANDCDWAAFFSSCGNSATSAEWSSASSAGLAPGESTYLYLYDVLAPVPTSPATYPYSGTFTSTVQDASNLAFYTGPSFQLEVIDPTTTLSWSANTPASFTAGSAPITITVTQGGDTAQAGLTINWFLDAISGYGSGTFSLTTSSVTAVSGGVSTASATFTPSNHAGDKDEIYAEVGSSDVYSPDSVETTTIPGSPASVAFSVNDGAFPSTYYISGENPGVNFGTPTYTGATRSAEIPSSAPLEVSVADKFGNPIAFGTAGLVVSTITLQALSGAGGWDHGGVALLTQISCGAGVSCTTGETSYNYFQGYTYATVGELEATITGTWQAAPFTAPGSSGSIFTSTDATSITANPSAPTNVAAGSYADVSGNLTATTQLGVPITIGLCLLDGANCAGNTVGYGGANSGFGAAGGTQVTGGASVLTTHSTVSGFGEAYYVDTVEGSVATFNATALDPTNASPTNILTWDTSDTVTTTAGPAASLTIVFYYLNTTPGAAADPIGSTSTDNPLTNIVTGQTVYPDATLADAYGNVVTVPGVIQAQIELSASAGSLSATTVYIKAGGSDTYSSFGAVAYYTPSGAAVGTVLTLTATGVVAGKSVSGSASLTVVSPTPTFDILSPTAQLDNVIYTTNTATVFHGWANVSTGYDAGPTQVTTIAEIGYSVNGKSWQTTPITPANTIHFAIAAFFTLGLNTIQFNTTDSNGNIFVSPVYQVLVDNTLPVIKFSSTTTFPFGVTVPVTIYSLYGDLNTSAVTAFFGNTDLNVTSADLAGTNTLGSNSSFTLNLNGITTGTWTLKVTASSYAGNTATATETITVTVAFADSVQYVANSATFTTEGAYGGVSAGFTNAWSTSQSLVFYAQFTNSTGSWVYASSGSLSSGQTGTEFIAITVPKLAAGTYTLTLFAVNTTNEPVSVSTTVSNFVVT